MGKILGMAIFILLGFKKLNIARSLKYISWNIS